MVLPIFKLIRPINLAFIVFTQFSFRYFLVPAFISNDYRFSDAAFAAIVLATVLVAAAGYIINDYFDVQIDEWNKPDRITVGRKITRRWAMMWHWIFSGSGLLLITLVSWFNNYLWLVIPFIISATLLWFYSARLKCIPLVGNLVVSLLTALTLFVVFLAEYRLSGVPNDYTLIALSFMLFAYFSSMMRELVKDMEDVQGDTADNCRTLAVVKGYKFVRRIFNLHAFWLFLLFLFILPRIISDGRYLTTAFACLVLLPLLLWIVVKMARADKKQQFHRLSTAIKVLMLFGVLMMFITYLE